MLRSFDHAQAVRDPLTTFAQADRSLRLQPPGPAPDEGTPAAIQEVAKHEIAQEAVSEATPPQPTRAGGSSAGAPRESVAEEPATALIQNVSVEDGGRPPAAARALSGRTIALIRGLLVVAGALAAAGIFQHALFKLLVARRHLYVERRRDERSASFARKQRPSVLVASLANGPRRAPVEHIDSPGITEGSPDITEGLRHILHAVERPAA
jgi:hypothetical protein